MFKQLSEYPDWKPFNKLNVFDTQGYAEAVARKAEQEILKQVVEWGENNNPFKGYVDVTGNISMAKEQGWDRFWKSLQEIVK